MIRTTTLAVLLAASFSAFAAEQAKAKVDLTKAKEIAEGMCVACHGADGNSPAPANPILAGQIPEYLYKQLSNFKAVDGAGGTQQRDHGRHGCSAVGRGHAEPVGVFLAAEDEAFSCQG
jgi:cytochrome c553